mmetsp:Transcript_3276/g.2229  ORF Transcript_3276/g.2229 Transcript_3276/m.2229 type:complete len:87 (-) Transcript_3276:25-285(-)
MRSVLGSGQHGFGSVPTEDCALRPNTHDALLVWRNRNLSDGSRVSVSNEVGDAFVVAPYLDEFVFSPTGEVFSLLGDSKSIDFPTS